MGNTSALNGDWRQIVDDFKNVENLSYERNIQEEQCRLQMKQAVRILGNDVPRKDVSRQMWESRASTGAAPGRREPGETVDSREPLSGCQRRDSNIRTSGSSLASYASYTGVIFISSSKSPFNELFRARDIGKTRHFRW